MRSAASFEKTLMLGKIEGRRRRGQQSIRWLDGITDSTDMSLSLQAMQEKKALSSRHLLKALVEGCCCCLVTKSCPILCDPRDCNLPGSSVHVISHAELSQTHVH